MAQPRILETQVTSPPPGSDFRSVMNALEGACLRKYLKVLEGRSLFHEGKSQNLFELIAVMLWLQ